MSSDSRGMVMCEGDQLSVLEKPPPTCNIVVIAKKDMLGVVDLQGLLSNLVTVGKFIRVAYNGVAGDAELQISVRKLGLDIAELCDESSLTIAKFRMTADSILTDLTGAYEFFLDDMEDMALTALESVGESAAQMTKAAERLAQLFEEEKKKVITTWETTARKKGFEEDEIKKIQTQIKENEEKGKKQERERQLAEEQTKKIEKEIQTASVEHEKAVENLAPTAADVVLGIFSLGICPAIRFSKAEKVIDKIHQKIDNLHSNKIKEIKAQREALKQIEECNLAIAQSSLEENVHKKAVTALHAAVGALNNLALIMQKTVTFWKGLKNVCEEQSQGKMQALLDTAQKYEDPKKRAKVYQSRGMKVRAVKEYAAWAAIGLVCEEYIDKIKGSRKELYDYLSENPTTEESKERIEQLSKELGNDIQKERLAIVEKEKTLVQETKEAHDATS